MPNFVSDTPTYDKYLDARISLLIVNAYDIINICKVARTFTAGLLSGTSWYHYRDDMRKISDALALVEHDALLLEHQISRISEALWKTYKEGEPDSTVFEVPFWDKVAEMREKYFEDVI